MKGWRQVMEQPSGGSLHKSVDPIQCGFKVDFPSSDCVYMVNHRSRFTSVQCFAFESSTLMQCNF